VSAAKPFAAEPGVAAKKRKAPRFWEIDALRGLAVIAMIAYHSFFCANYIGLSALSPYHGFLGISPLFIAATFLFVSGLSMRASRDSAIARGEAPGFKRQARRSLLIGAGALVITLVTFFAAGLESFVAFGILHCVALAGIILYPFLGRRWLNLCIGLPLIVAGFLFLHGREFPRFAWWFFILGFRPEGYYPLDFVPLIPWLGFSFLGIFAASFLYKDGRRAFSWPFGGTSPQARFLSFLGRSSLIIYVVHIPLILGILLAIKFFL
jgi:uncharacterized membrane protein